MDEIVREFLVESHENLDQLDQDLVALESEPGSRSLIASVFRTIHTIKGTSGFLAFSRLERVAHAGENLLVELRDGRRSMDQATTDVLLRLVDTIREILRAIEVEGGEGGVEIDAVIAAIEAIQAIEPGAEPAAEAAPEPAAAPVEPDPAPVAAAPVAAPAAPAVVPAPAPAPAVETVAPEPAVAAAPAPAAPAAAPAAAEELGSLRAGAADASIRVDVDLLDALMRQVGELVLARNQISRLAGDTDDVDLARSAQRLNLIAGELQEGVMKTRMQPIEHLWSKMPRMVRDVAAACHREVQLELSGGDTELDRSLLEAVKDPLTHLVRNAVDHGIEASADRIAAGKAPKGVLALRAYHASGQVVVEVSDDGRGIDPEKIGAKAVQKGLRTADQVAAMSQADLLQLLFLAGFSTAEVVSNVSGRGVGMDVVRTKIESIGGAVEVDSVVGRGTTWRLRIPLTLAIMPALTVECSGDLYAIPQVNLLELVALDSQRSESGIEHIHEAAVYRLRGELLPLVSLSEVLEVGGERPENAVIAVVQSDQQRFGLLVDRVLNTEEIVVKPLSARLKAIGAYSGATVLGDGHVALILDVQAIARRALAGELDVAARDAHDNAAANAVRDTQQVLVVGIGGGRQVAMPLASVARLEHVQADQVEYVGGREVVQYRGTILPLARLDRILGAYGSEESSELLLVVYSRAGRSVGLVVKEIVDIVDDDSARHSDIEDAGLVGSTVLGEKVTELLDVRRAILAADAAFYDERPEHRSTYDDLPTQVGGSELVGATR
ncbi:chemotaxis protein CheA [Cellulosimicrobium cellulans]|uniref:chemotaxis protein CheA n=1 Tax=Cellulosimicrobium cellulans TaxID=1710 RepID=UPI0021CB6CCE|nr:chemotaxis protein CheA [Cellulosimicrobium cellulans]